ncbi:MAG TPA: hypothetical protein VFI85_08540 [Methyloceanibacter sp.]|nr:hypothetical protein [Methyloceanibacter sp.]
MRMSVVPHRSGKTEPQAAAPSRERAKTIATSALRVAERIAKLADETAKETKTVTANAVAASKVGLARAVEIGRENVLPEIERASAKLKEHTRRDRLEHDYRTYLLKLHERVLDPAVEQLFFKPTKDPVPLSGLTIRGNYREYGHDYRPSPCRLVEWTIAALDYDLSRLTFVDHGAGKGRVLLLASQHPFQAVGGVEFAEELHDDATMNIAQFPRSRMKCRTVECVLDDASALGPPEGEAVHYFFNPFAREVFAEVLDNIVVSYRRRPRRLYLILVDPVASDLIDQSGVFQRHALPQIERLKIKAFSPYEVALYRSLA